MRNLRVWHAGYRSIFVWFCSVKINVFPRVYTSTYPREFFDRTTTLEWRIKKAHTTSHSWDIIPAVHSGFWRFSAVLVSYICFRNLQITFKKWYFCLKWRLNEVHTTSDSGYKNSAVIGGFRENTSIPARSPPRVVFITINWSKKVGPANSLENRHLPQKSPQKIYKS